MALLGRLENSEIFMKVKPIRMDSMDGEEEYSIHSVAHRAKLDGSKMVFLLVIAGDIRTMNSWVKAGMRMVK